MAGITGEIVIDRPVDVVFDFVADERNEPKYNPRLRRSEKLTEGPIGAGTRFAASIQSLARPLDMVIEVTSYDRPTEFASTTTMSSAQIHGTLTFEPHQAGTLMRWSWEVHPKGPAKLLTPFITYLGKRQEQGIWASLKRYLEAGRPLPGAARTLRPQER